MLGDHEGIFGVEDGFALVHSPPPPSPTPRPPVTDDLTETAPIQNLTLQEVQSWLYPGKPLLFFIALSKRVPVCLFAFKKEFSLGESRAVDL